MRKALAALAPFVRLVAAFPMHLIAAFLAAVLAEALLTIQPQLLRGFIDSTTAGLPAAQLWAFPAFMAASAVLAYAFDFLSVAIRYALERDLERSLKELYLDIADRGRAEVVQFSLWSGVAKLSQLALAVTLDFALVLSRIAIILVFLSAGQPVLAAGALVALAVGTIATIATTGRIGRISKTIGFGTGRTVSAALGSSLLSARRELGRVYALDRRLFALKSLNVAVSFAMFRVLPVGVIAWKVAGADISLGELASIFLYVSMLRVPYLDLNALLQESLTSLSESALFREELERGLAVRQAAERVGAGLVWERTAARAGAPLSTASASDARVFHDDVAPTAKAAILEGLAARSRAGAVIVFSEDPRLARFAHFVREGDSLRTVLSVPEAA
ncbi:MAG: ABC transporter ATP-binding protein [Elusimicrobia bacterium]|nr:ABC transporter ATP-binding protein [Elusimicrobiota bacterium]